MDLLGLPSSIHRKLSDLQLLLEHGTTDAHAEDWLRSDTCAFSFEVQARMAMLIDELADWFLYQHCLMLRASVHDAPDPDALESTMRWSSA